MRPILLVYCSRTRSSMIGAIFAEHGIWWGDDRPDYRYQPYELREAVKRIIGVVGKHNLGYVCPEIDAWPEVAECFPRAERWFFKMPVEYWPALKSVNPMNVFVWRRPRDAARSVDLKNPGATFKVALPIIERRYQAMRFIESQHGGVWVNTDEIASGNYSSLQAAFEYCGLDLDMAAVGRAIF